MARILLIEPDRQLADIYAQALRVDAHTVQTCATAQQAIHGTDEQQPDVIILELQLVEHSGIEFLYELRSYPEWQAIPVLIHTHVPPGEFADNWQLCKEQLNVTNFLYKPHTSLAALRRAVTELMTVPA